MAKISRVQWDKTPFFRGEERILSRLIVLENSLNFAGPDAATTVAVPKWEIILEFFSSEAAQQL